MNQESTIAVTGLSWAGFTFGFSLLNAFAELPPMDNSILLVMIGVGFTSVFVAMGVGE